jgi:hypothetical protein
MKWASAVRQRPHLNREKGAGRPLSFNGEILKKGNASNVDTHCSFDKFLKNIDTQFPIFTIHLILVCFSKDVS